jgi:hypothetical protein
MEMPVASRAFRISVVFEHSLGDTNLRQPKSLKCLKISCVLQFFIPIGIKRL